MANRVNVDVHVRNLTRPELERMRRGFNRLGQDMDRMVAGRTQENFDRLSQSLTEARRNLGSLRGSIPDAEFFRLDDAVNRASRTMRSGFDNQTTLSIGRVRDAVVDLTGSIGDLERQGRIRIEPDEAGLRDGRRRITSWLRSLAGMRARVGIDVDESGTRRWTRRLSHLMTSPMRAVAGTISGMLQDGVGQGIINGVKAGGPVAGGLLVAAILSALTLVGAALAGLITTALGAAFVGIAGVSAAQSKTVKDQWKKTLESLKENFADIGEPMIPVLTRALGLIEDMADRAAPAFRKAIEDATPATNEFIDSLLRGFERFGEEAFGPIMDAWKVFAPVFGEQWEEFMGELGSAFADMARLVEEHPTEIAAALGVVFETIELLIRTVTFLGDAWVASLRAAGDTAGFFLKVVGNVIDAATGMVSILLHGIASVESAIPGLGTRAQEAAEEFDRWRESAVNDFRVMSERAFGFGETLDRMNRTRRLQADISGWNQKLSEAQRKLKQTTDQKAKARLVADISDLHNKIVQAKKELESINGRVARTTVVHQTVYTNTTGRPQRGEGANSIFAHGGVRGMSAAATGGVRGNMTLVGEQGPELINLAPGSRVRSNPDTRRLLSSGGGGGDTVTLEIDSSGSRVDDLLVEILRRSVKAKGGNVQLAVMGRS